MRILYFLVMSFFVIFPYDAFSCAISAPLLNADVASRQLSGFFDLRGRSSYVQVSNSSNEPIRIHIQIFQHDRDCGQLNFFDDLTVDDTVVYNIDNIIKNDGTEVSASLADDSYGYVVITDTNLSAVNSMVGNFRIIDDTGYEYRSNLVGSSEMTFPVLMSKYTANFNIIDNASHSDIVGYVYRGRNSTSATNFKSGVSFDVFVFDLSESPLSCSNRNFACGKKMYYGVNGDMPPSRGDELVCPGGGLADNPGGVISFENPVFGSGYQQDDDVFVHFIGVNNNNGTGSMDRWMLTVF